MPPTLKNIILTFLLAIIIIACKKGSIETDYNPNIRVANNQAIAERAYSEVFNIFFIVVNDSLLKSQGSKEIFGALCTYEAMPEIIYHIDFLPYYTECPDGKIRKGSITARLDMDFSELGSSAELTFSGYEVEYLKLDSNVYISNQGLSAGMLPLYEYEVPAVTLSFIDSLDTKSYSWSSSKLFVHVQGNNTPYDQSDDIFEIAGESSGTDINGVSFTASTEESLGNYFDCRWIRTGKTLLSIPGLDVSTGYIDYIGEDSCTNIIMYSFNGNPFYDRFIYH